MQVNVSGMKAELAAFKRFLKDYEDDCRNLYHTLNYTNTYWQDPHAMKFFDSVKLEEIKVDTMQNEFQALKEVYTYFVEKYETFGNKVFFDLENRESCLAKIDSYILKMRNVIATYAGIDTSFCPKEASLLRKEKQKLENDVKVLEQYRVDLKEKLIEIEEIEKNIQLKLSKIDIEVIKETSIKEFLGQVI